ncbi:hypothetical protein BJV74DRAFT_617005 [Russula compacta]|nr:hypothetical protein BJV74DRAFT_617005 [Russula compacta]
MPLFGTRRHRTRDEVNVTTSPRRRGWTLSPRKNRDRVAGGYRAALVNPNTTRRGRRHAKRELRRMGRGDEAHVPFMTKVKRTLGIRSTPRSERRWSRRRRDDYDDYGDNIRGGGWFSGRYRSRRYV